MPRNRLKNGTPTPKAMAALSWKGLGVGNGEGAAGLVRTEEKQFTHCSNNADNPTVVRFGGRAWALIHIGGTELHSSPRMPQPPPLIIDADVAPAPATG